MCWHTIMAIKLIAVYRENKGLLFHVNVLLDKFKGIILQWQMS